MDLRDPCIELDAFLQIVFIKDIDILKKKKKQIESKVFFRDSVYSMGS